MLVSSSFGTDGFVKFFIYIELIFKLQDEREGSNLVFACYLSLPVLFVEGTVFLNNMFLIA